MAQSSDSSPSNSKESPPSDGNEDSGGNNDGNNKSGGNGNSGGNNGNKNGNQNKNNDQNSGGDESSGGDNGNNNNNDQNNNNNNNNDNDDDNNNSGNNGNDDNNNRNNNNQNNDQSNNNKDNNNNQNNTNNNGNNNNQNNDQNNNNNNNGNNNNQNNDQNKNNQNNNGGNNNQNNNGGNNWYAPPPPKSRNWLAPPPPLHQKNSPPKAAVPAKDSKSSSNTPSTVVIVGLAAGAGLLFFMLLLFCACSRKKKRRQTSHLMDNPDRYRPNDYWQSGGMYKPHEHVMNMPPPPAAYSGWNNAGTHHPHNMISSEMNSSNFSGPHGPPQPPPHPSVALGYNTSTFTYDDLAVATSGFAHAKLLGQGGFGFVHKGVLPNGKEIAVKSLKAGSGQGDREFAAEVEIISRVHHRHLVSLVGYCLNGERKLLVYEFVSNNTLEFHLYNKNRPPLDWASRVKIALGSAKGLAYLHEDCHPKIIHRDIKAANILIDDHFEAKVADFGLAKLNQENATHVSTRVMGTFGYLAPEYASSGKLTEKSDVFSFGVMLLELITGRRPVDNTGDLDEDTLVDWARPLLTKAMEDRDYFELADRRLENNYDHEGMARMVACASTSIRHSAKKRPKMSQIVRVLEGDVSLDDLHDGIKPSPSGLFGGSNTSSEIDSDSYNANMKNFRKAPLGGSHDYPSSEEMVKKL